MAFTRARRITRRYSPAALANENFKIERIPAAYFITDFVPEILVAGDGNGTLSFGSTSGGTDLATTGNVGVTVLGQKSAAIANKVLYAATESVWANYIVGTATIKPVVRVHLTLTPVAE